MSISRFIGGYGVCCSVGVNESYQGLVRLEVRQVRGTSVVPKKGRLL